MLRRGWRVFGRPFSFLVGSVDEPTAVRPSGSPWRTARVEELKIQRPRRVRIVVSGGGFGGAVVGKATKMSTRRQALGIICVLALSWSLFAGPAAAQDWSVAPPPDGDVQASFDETLAPYGDWVDVNGERAWRPSASIVGEDFQPYATGGQWLSSDYGWYFQSDYPWGWAPFHYGRWALDVNNGWVWLPGTVWAPAWVDWRSGGGYIGWAPLPPIGWSVVVQPWRPYWCFVPVANFAGANFWAYRLPVERVHYAYAATAPVHQAVAFGGARWYAGPQVSQVEHFTGQPVPRVTGTLTPPAPGRVQPVQLQPPRGFAGGMGVNPRPATYGNPGGARPAGTAAPPASHPYQPAVAPNRSAPPTHVPAPAPHAAPRGFYVQPSPTAQAYAGVSSATYRFPSASGRPPPNWNGTAAVRNSSPPTSFAGGQGFSSSALSASRGPSYGGPRGSSGGHAGRH
jgi:hypothetical protein